MTLPTVTPQCVNNTNYSKCIMHDRLGSCTNDKQHLYTNEVLFERGQGIVGRLHYWQGDVFVLSINSQ